MAQPIIELKHVSAAYGAVMALEDVSLQVYDHDYLGIIGPNGGGKTTLMRVILGLMKPQAGEIIFRRGDKIVNELSMGYLPQYNEIDRKFPISVYEVILSGLSRQKHFLRPYTTEQHQQVRRAIERLELEGLEKRHIGQLSGGQLQRVLLARAVVSNPEVVVLDEPNTYIDKRFQEQMYEMLHRLNEDCAVIVVSHDIAEIIENVKHVACVNRTLHYHEHTDIPITKIEQHFLSIRP
uniref:Metal ABC transporter ATP-binding protein n=1 Tax=Prevotella sp. GTC17260 TaxID=3236796 RepID=A0AB33JI97_9BACT